MGLCIQLVMLLHMNLEGNFVDAATREGFQIAHDISSYSFTAMAKGAKPMLNENAALVNSYLSGSYSISSKLQCHGSC